MKPRVLIVEDDEVQLEGIEKDLLQLSQDQKHHYGIEGFTIDKAMTDEDAMALLRKASQSCSPYDLVLQDLSVPLNKESATESPERGLRMLKFAMESGAARGVIVQSVFTMYDYVLNSFREGAVDFIMKPWTKEVLQTQVLKYFERLSARIFEERVKTLAGENILILEKRVEELAPYGEKILIQKLGVCFSRFVQSVVNEIEGLEEGFKERWELDIKRDSDDSQVRHLILLEEAVRNAKREWSDVLLKTATEKGGEEAPKVCIVEDLLREIRDYVYPSLASKKVELTGIWSERTPVRTFKDDVKSVLKEIVLGALSELADHDNSRKQISVSISELNGRAKVLFKDNLGLIMPKPVGSVNEGISVLAGPRFERAWGLSVAQHIALRGGGRLDVRSNGEGNEITYLIPLAEHA